MTPQDSAIFLPALIGAFIFGLKKAISKELYKKVRNYVPWVAMLLGGIISAIYGAVYNLNTQDMFITITQGVVVGAAAVGYREAAVRMAKKMIQ